MKNKHNKEYKGQNCKFEAYLICVIVGRLLIKKKIRIHFLDEMSIAAAQLVHISLLKIKLVTGPFS